LHRVRTAPSAAAAGWAIMTYEKNLKKNIPPCIFNVPNHHTTTAIFITRSGSAQQENIVSQGLNKTVTTHHYVFNIQHSREE
jgi:hypothetical protein